ncbi:MAG: AAA family ATPase [Candidatus Hodarchaeales archaeon]
MPELGTYTSTKPPLVFLTSNSTRDLSEALRRRCLYIYLDFPGPEEEERILKLHCPGAENAFLKKLTMIIAGIRKLDLKKHPSISESIDWVSLLESENLT